MQHWLVFSLFLAQAGAGQESTVTVRTGSGVETFQLADPAEWNAPRARAARRNADRASKAGVEPAPTHGFVLEAALLVETDDPWALQSWIAEARAVATVAPLAAAPGFYLIQAESVAAAVQLQEALAAVYPPGSVYLDVDRPKAARGVPSDPLFAQQWHLRNDSDPRADVNAEAAWDAGFTGEGVVVGVLEGGWQTDHPDLQANYLAAASQAGRSSSHGTSVAGVVGARAGNGAGGVGLAFAARLSLQLNGSSSQNATAFGFRNDLNHIKNNSWGPFDDGTISYLSSAERGALAEAAANGRGGLGEIFAWAAGNGGTRDRCDYDPYASSRYVVAIGAVGDRNTRSWFNETGSSMLVVAHSSGNDRGITTTNSGSGYTSSFGGTSSASPLGAAVIALMLQANPRLSWRDVQGVLAHAARPVDPGNSRWMVNGAGLAINENYGYGLVDAPAAVATALAWRAYGAEQTADSAPLPVARAIPDNDAAGVVQTWNCPQHLRIENVELILNARHGEVGDLQVVLRSPSGTESLLAEARGDATDDYANYVFTSRRCRDEDAFGTWEVRLADRGAGTTGTWTDFRIKIYGHDGGGGPGLTLWTEALRAGAAATVSFEHGGANAPTYLFHGTAAGSTAVANLNVTLGIAAARQVRSAATSDGSGNAQWNLRLPARAAGRTVFLQAAQQGAVSNLWSIRIN